MRLLVPFLAVLALAACGSEQASTPATTAPQADDGASLAGPSLDGERVSLADFRGKPVFVNVWSSW